MQMQNYYLFFKKIIMKKLALITLTAWVLLSSQTFADNQNILLTTTKLTTIASTWAVLNLETLTQKYDVILRNNNISWDNEYNSKNYFTSKLKTTDLVIPDEIKLNSTRIYFLVEEWSPIMYFKSTMAEQADVANTAEVKKEYNYKTVDFVEWKSDYVFNNTDLVKDFSKDEYKSVSISLVADLKTWEKLNLTNSAYLTIWNKLRILDALLNEKNKDSNIQSYYDNQSIENYLEKMSEKLSRADYKKVLTNAQNKLKSLIKQNETIKNNILNSITKESDLSLNLDKYSNYQDTSSLLNSVFVATNNQIQKVKSYEIIDNVFKK